MVDFVPRVDIEANRIFYKYIDEHADKTEWETPSDQDEVKVNFELKQNDKVLLSKLGWETNMMHEDLTVTFSKIIQSLKRGEKSRVEIKSTFVPEEDPDLLKMLQDTSN